MTDFYFRSNAYGDGSYYFRSQQVSDVNAINMTLPQLTVSANAISFQKITAGGVIDTSIHSFFHLIDVPIVAGDELFVPNIWQGSLITVDPSGTFVINPALPDYTQFPRMFRKVSTGVLYVDTLTFNQAADAILGSVAITLPQLTMVLATTVQPPIALQAQASAVITLPLIGVSASGNVVDQAVTGGVSVTLPNISMHLIGQAQSLAATAGIFTNKKFTFDEYPDIPVLVCGDTFKAIGRLTISDPEVPWDVSTASSIKVCIVSADHTTKLTDDVTLSAIDLGADWVNGWVTVTIPKSVTQQAARYMTEEKIVKIEMQIAFSNGEDYSVFEPIVARQGFIF